jgi:hypothetical protein
MITLAYLAQLQTNKMSIFVTLYMRTTLILFWSLVGIAGSHAQSLAPEAIAAAGGHFSGPDAQLSWTLGESVSEHFSRTGSAQLTQGFHQANLAIVPVDAPAAVGCCIKVYPNPAADWVNVEAPSALAPLGLELYDWAGRVLLRQAPSARQPLHRLDLSGYVTGTYWLRLHTAAGQTIQTFTIIKAR